MVPSPTYTLKSQQGNSLDKSIVLVSLLRGVGYDAYVVSGYASKRITTLDETHLEVPVESFDDAETGVRKVSVKEDANGAKYHVKPVRQLKSQFLLKREELLQKQKETQAEQQRKKAQELQLHQEQLARSFEFELRLCLRVGSSAPRGR